MNVSDIATDQITAYALNSRHSVRILELSCVYCVCGGFLLLLADSRLVAICLFVANGWLLLQLLLLLLLIDNQ